MAERIGDEILQQYRESGYAIIERLFDGDELATIQAEVNRLLPAWQDARRVSARQRVHQFPFGQGRPAKGEPVFVDAINDATVDERIADFVRRCLGTDDIVMDHSGLVGKYPGGSYDQPLHQDFFKYSLVVPRNDPGFGHVQVFIYWEDVTLELGPTCVLPRQFADGLGGVVSRDPEQGRAFVGIEVDPADCRPDLYEHEVPVTVPAGSVLVYSTDVFHRGSQVTGLEGRRVSQHIVYRCVGNPWNVDSGFVDRGGDPVMIRFLERATPRARTLIGFPAPDDAYWCRETVEGVQRRYPGMDMSSYGRTGAAAR